MQIQEAGALVSAIGQSVELAGVAWLGIAVLTGIKNAKKKLDKGLELAMEQSNRLTAVITEVGLTPEQRKSKQDEITAWFTAELERHEIQLVRYVDVTVARLWMQYLITRDQARSWLGGAAFVFLGLLMAVVGGWLQAAG